MYNLPYNVLRHYHRGEKNSAGLRHLAQALDLPGLQQFGLSHPQEGLQELVPGETKETKMANLKPMGIYIYILYMCVCLYINMCMYILCIYICIIYTYVFKID
jgi:hypothetical protein